MIREQLRCRATEASNVRVLGLFINLKGLHHGARRRGFGPLILIGVESRRPCRECQKMIASIDVCHAGSRVQRADLERVSTTSDNLVVKEFDPAHRMTSSTCVQADQSADEKIEIALHRHFADVYRPVADDHF